MRRSFQILIFILTPGLVAAQARFFDYYHKTQGDDSFFDVKEDNAGNFYLLGTTNEAADTPPTSTYIIKLDPSGNFIKSSVLEPQNHITSLKKLIRFDNNHFLAAGNMSESDDGSSQLLLVKFDLDLNVIWAKSFKNPAPWQYIEDIQYSRDSSHFILTGMKGKEGYFAKVSLAGDSLDQKFYSFKPNVFFFDILELPNNNGYYLFTLFTHMPNDSSIPAESGTRLVKLTKDLVIDTVVTLQTSLTYPHLSYNVAFDNYLTALWMSEESFVVGGPVHNRKEIFPNYHSGDLGIMQWDTNFNEVFYNIYGRYDTTEFSGLRSMDFRDTSSIYLAGIGDFNINFYSDNIIDFYLVKTNSKGIAKWEQHYNNNSYLLMFSVLATSDGGAMIVGSSYKEGLNGPKERDGYAVKVDSNGNSRITPVGINELTSELSKTFSISPNPFNDILHVQLYQPGTSRIELFDVYGRLIFSREIREHTNRLQTGSLAGGVYMYRLTHNEGRRYTGKIIKR